MKKRCAVILAAICCAAFTVPALAEVKVEGMIQNDFYYFDQSKERVLGGLRKNATTLQDDWQTTRINMPQPLNRITVRYTGEDKVVNGYIQIRAGGSRAQANQTVPFNNALGSESAFSWEYAWIDWHINPSFYLRFGRQDQTFGGAYAPAQGLGWNDGHIIGLNFGNITAQSRDAIRAFIKFNDNIRMEIELLDPNTERYFTGATATELALPRDAALGGNGFESNVWPRFDISLPMKFGNFQIEPGFTYLKQEWDQVLAGSDDSYDVWGLTLGGKAGFGPFSIAGEITYGQNLGPNSSHWGAANGQAVAYNPTGAANANLRKIEDGETLAWWIQLGFDFGPFAIQGVVGSCNGQNDGDPALARAADANEWDRTQWMYGMNFPIKITKTFTITPSIFYYDFGDDEEVGGSVWNMDYGTELVVGVAFQLVF